MWLLLKNLARLRLSGGGYQEIVEADGEMVTGRVLVGAGMVGMVVERKEEVVMAVEH